MEEDRIFSEVVRAMFYLILTALVVSFIADKIVTGLEIYVHEILLAMTLIPVISLVSVFPFAQRKIKFLITLVLIEMVVAMYMAFSS